MRPLKPYFQLVRLPNLFTAAADSFAGFLLAGGAIGDVQRWLPLCGASVAIYAAGITLNDLFDLQIDRRERPGRPLPSGAVSRGFAVGLGVVGMALGLGLSAWVSVASLTVAAILVLCVLLYDGGLKRTLLGPVAMGACRGLNLLLGLSIARDFGGAWGWIAAGSLVVFVAGITWISRFEVETGRSIGVIAGLILQNAALIALLAVTFHASSFPGASDRPIIPLEGLLLLATISFVVNLAGGRAVTSPTPSTLQKAVKTGVLSLVWIDVALVASVRGPGAALLTAAFWLPAFLLGRWLYST